MQTLVELSTTPAKPCRRKLLKLATGLSISLPTYRVFAKADSSTLSCHRVHNQITATGIKQDAIVLVDSSIREFKGNGFYLYPDWGKPLVYEVKKKGSMLTFHYPGIEDTLWELSANQINARFSGRVESVLDDNQKSLVSLGIDTATLTPLDVPDFPVS